MTQIPRSLYKSTVSLSSDIVPLIPPSCLPFLKQPFYITMGIGSTVKNMLSTEDSAADRSVGNANVQNTYEKRDNLVGDRSSHQLPPGTGPGTSGKPAVVASELAMQSDLERSRTGQGTSGYGTDAAAAMGGTLAGTHHGGSSPGQNGTPARNTSGSGTGTGFAPEAAAGSVHRNSAIGGDQVTTGGQAPVTYAGASELDSDTRRRYGSFDNSDSTQPGVKRGTGTTTYREPTGLGTAVGRGGVLEEGHASGHTKHNEPTGKTQEDTNQLHPVLHERVRHLELEEVTHVKDLERHIHHIQHHTQPVIVSEELQERLRDNVRPVTRVNEIHANKPEDSTLFEDQIYQHRDSLVHGEKERTIIHKGTTVNETIHHHVHHVIQPVIEKETIEKERVRTTIPIREVTQEAPIVHQSQMHAPVAMEHFLQRGGTLKSGVLQDEILRKVMHSGKCIREIDGAGDSFGDKKSGSKNVKGATSTGLMDEDGVPSKGGDQHTDQANVVSSRN